KPPCLMFPPEVPQRYGFRAERSSRPEEDLRMQRPTPAWGRGGRPTATRDLTPATTLRTRRKPRRRFPPEVLTDAEVRALLDACPDTHTGVRNRALLALLYRGGLRLGEALTLRPKDLDLAEGVVRVLHAKGGS